MLQVFAYIVAFVALGTAVRGELELLQLGRSSRNPVVGSQGIGQTTVEHVLAEKVLGELRELRLSHGRDKRQSEPSGTPTTQGNHEFDDIYRYARVHYSGQRSNAIFVLTYDLSNNGLPTHTNLYRSVDYGSHFTAIESNLDPNVADPLLWYNFYTSDSNKDMLVFPHATQAKFYYTTNEGDTWSVQAFNPSTINPRSLLWNPVDDQLIVAHDTLNDHLYVTENLGATWTKIADYVDNPNDYQWGDANVDSDESIIYFNVYDPAEKARGNDTVDLYTLTRPYATADKTEFDPNLGKHDAFLLLGPYIFAQKTDSQGDISLLVSHQRQPFNYAKIPSFLPHERYLVSHINSLQAMVIVGHTTTQHNLYLSDATGVFYVLSLSDIVIEGNILDLEVIEGVNGTMVANQYVRDDPTVINAPMRTLLTLDNGGEWVLLRPPSRDVEGIPISCEPPLCSLHFHMGTSDYARLGVYSQASSPGIIVAHGNTGEELAEDPDLYISRDGGITWEETLAGSWGVTMADHGGLLVAASDYHGDPSSTIMYSCNEGVTWQSYDFSNFNIGNMIVFGVLTEPGEHTTVVSLYGVETDSAPDFKWVVVTLNFTSIFPRVCTDGDYYDWEPWDERTDGEDCILGSTVTIQRRKIDVCCLNGHEYDRESNFGICSCTEQDFECDYGYMRSDGFTGPCVRDPTIILPSYCSDPSVYTYQQTRGYRKIAGDVCQGGDEAAFSPYTAICCNQTTTPQVVDCGPLPDPPNGHVTSSSTTLASVATFTCNPLYELHGVNVRACQTDGTWSGTQPTCALGTNLQCDVLRPPSNGRVDQQGIYTGATASYSCGAGFVLAGAPYRTCLSTGVWSDSQPRCTTVNCGSLADPEGGSVSMTAMTFGSVATYSCDAHYELSGVGARFCLDDGAWSGSAPTCNADVHCGTLADPDGGSVTVTDAHFGSVATYTCNSGHELSGLSVRVCQANGTWYGSSPTCVKQKAESSSSEDDGVTAGDAVFGLFVLLLILTVVILSVAVCICGWKQKKLRRRYLNAITGPHERQFSYRNMSTFEPLTDSEPLTAANPDDPRDGGGDDNDDDDEPIVP